MYSTWLSEAFAPCAYLGGLDPNALPSSHPDYVAFSGGLCERGPHATAMRRKQAQQQQMCHAALLAAGPVEGVEGERPSKAQRRREQADDNEARRTTTSRGPPGRRTTSCATPSR